MAEKKLYQADWRRGETDGDQAQATVRRILNMDLDNTGRLDTRLPFVTSENINGGQVTPVDYSPDWSDATSWFASVADDHIDMIPVNGSVVRAVDAIPIALTGVTAIDANNSQIVSYGDKVFVSVTNADGSYGGVHVIMSQNDKGRFMAPKQCIGTVHEYLPAATPTTWVSYRVEMNSPVLSIERITGFGFIDDGTTPGLIEDQPYADIDLHDKYEDSRLALMDKVGENPTISVGLLADMVAPDGDYGSTPSTSVAARGPLGMFGRSAVVKYKVQFIFYGGIQSRLSNAVTVSGWDEEHVLHNSNNEVFVYSIGLVPIISKSIDKAIKGINIYRKIVDSANPELEADTDYNLVETVWLDNEIINDANDDIGVTSIEEKRATFSTNVNNTVPNIAFPTVDWWWKANHWDDVSSPFSQKKFRCRDGETWKTSGWINVASDFLMFLAEHYGASCECEFELPNYNNVDVGLIMSGNPLVTFNAIIASRKHGFNGEVNTVIRSGSDFPDVAVRDDTTGLLVYKARSVLPIGDVANQNASFSRSGATLHNGYMAGIEMLSAPVFTADVTSGFTKETGDWESTRLPFVGYRDTGAVSPDSELSIVGGNSEDFVSVAPDAIAVSGGRLMGIGGKHDGETHTSRFWYSLFQNYGMVLEGNYLDYGARNDGIGMAISAYRGNVIIHFSSATYVVDVSGGSDMSWRELGANTGVGLLNKFALIECPIGVVWCDSNGVYIFNGRGINEISHMDEAGITTKDTYLTMINGNEDRVRASYKKNKKQVWITVGKSVMVWDIRSGAWHENEMDEVFNSIGDFDLLGFSNTSEEPIAICKTIGGTIHFMVESELDSDAVFDWGVDIDFDAGAPELVKKSKRFYFDIMSLANGNKITVDVKGQGGGVITQDLEVAQVADVAEPDVETMIRMSASARGRSILMSLRNKAGTKWLGTIESLGMSHKFKALK